MNIYINHCGCSDSIWGGDYGCRVILCIPQYECRADIYKRKYAPDFNNVLDVVNEDTIDETFRLKPEVHTWLMENVKDRILAKWEIDDGEFPQGWAAMERSQETNRIFQLF